MPTISAYTSDELKKKIDRIMREEGRRQGQIGSTALELYAHLPAAARHAFLEVVAAEEELGAGILERAMAEVSRALLSAKWEISDARLRLEIAEQTDLPEDELSEEEIAEIAVRMTTGQDA